MNIEKRKIRELEPGKIYKCVYKGVENAFFYKVDDEGRLFSYRKNVGTWRETTLTYNRIFEVCFIEAKGIDWTKVPRGTKVQVRDNCDSEWENAYFVKINKNERHPFEAAFYLDDDFIGVVMEDDSEYWSRCKIHESVKILDDWWLK